jgi:hypothetical protein
LGFQQVRHLNNYAAIPGENTDRRAVEKGVRRANFGTHLHSVIPAQAGIQGFSARFRIPAFAGMTRSIFQQPH